MPGRISAHSVLVMPSFDSTRNSGTIVTWIGIMSDPMTTANIALRPRNRSRANAYAAVEHVISWATVMLVDTMIELRKNRKYGTCSVTLPKLCTVRFDGCNVGGSR